MRGGQNQTMTEQTDTAAIPETADIDLIRRVIPHRYPFLLIDRAAYDDISAEVEAQRWTPKMAEVSFDLADFNKDSDGYNAKLQEALS